MRPSELRTCLGRGQAPPPAFNNVTLDEHPAGSLALGALALRRPPVPDQGLAVGGVLARPVLFRNSPFQPLDGKRYLKRLLLVAEAMHLDAAVVRHHFLET
jgi:hypothetical protein